MSTRTLVNHFDRRKGVADIFITPPGADPHRVGYLRAEGGWFCMTCQTRRCLWISEAKAAVTDMNQEQE